MNEQSCNTCDSFILQVSCQRHEKKEEAERTFIISWIMAHDWHIPDEQWDTFLASNDMSSY